MLKVRCWIGVVSTPILLASVGCTTGPQSYLSRNRGLPPERLMAMARTFERQGHIAQAKSAYMQVLASQPDYPNARESFNSIVASEMQKNGDGRTAPIQLAAPYKPLETQQKIAATRVEPSLNATSQPLPAQPASAALTDQTLDLQISSIELSATPAPVAIPSQSSTDIVSIESNEVNGSNGFIESVSSTESDFPPSPEPASETKIASEDLIEFLPPTVLEEKEEEEIASFHDLEQFFGPFEVAMVKSLKANREEFQPALTKLALNRKTEINLRTRAVFLLGAIGSDAMDAAPVLSIEMLECDDLQLKVDLAEAVLKIHAENIDAINVLIGCLNGSNRNVQQTAAFALRNAVSPQTNFVIDALIDALNTEDLKLRRMIFLTLAEFGPAAERAIPELEAALESTDPATREVAKTSLACIAPDRRSAAKHTRSTQWSISRNQ